MRYLENKNMLTTDDVGLRSVNFANKYPSLYLLLIRAHKQIKQNESLYLDKHVR